MKAGEKGKRQNRSITGKKKSSDQGTEGARRGFLAQRRRKKRFSMTSGGEKEE